MENETSLINSISIIYKITNQAESITILPTTYGNYVFS